MDLICLSLFEWVMAGLPAMAPPKRENKDKSNSNSTMQPPKAINQITFLLS